MLSLQRPDLMRTSCYVNGVWLPDSEGAELPVVNPATGEPIGKVASVAEVETRRAIDAADRALPDWRNTPAKDRSQLLRRLYELMVENIEDLALLLTAEQGKPLREAKAEILYGASYVEWFAEEAKRINGALIPSPHARQKILVIKQPVGVVGAITPWNFPNAMLARKLAPALAAGCTFVGKPAQQTPLSALALAALVEEAGFPAGVVNIVVGADAQAIGRELTTHPQVRKITFTGSTAVGKQLLAQCASTVKKVTMELGGNAPFVVFDDADMDAAIEGLVASKFRAAGQTCICPNRVLVQETVYNRFAQRLCARIDRLKIGNGRDEGVDIGPLINRAACEKVAELVANALDLGAQQTQYRGLIPDGECFFAPLVLRDVSPEMRVFQEEVFGPVIPLTKFSTEREALDLANRTSFGLASYVYTRDIDRIWRFSENLEYGMVGINESAISNAMAPFGGVKESGLGREGSHYGIEEYLEIKYLAQGNLARRYD